MACKKKYGHLAQFIYVMAKHQNLSLSTVPRKYNIIRGYKTSFKLEKALYRDPVLQKRLIKGIGEECLLQETIKFVGNCREIVFNVILGLYLMNLTAIFDLLLVTITNPSHC